MSSVEELDRLLRRFAKTGDPKVLAKAQELSKEMEAQDAKMETEG